MACSGTEELLLAGLEEESIVDGPGLRFTVFVQGCPHHCPGCHNPQTHAFTGGQRITVGQILERFDEDPLLSGITLSGGEPFCQAAPLSALAEQVHARGKNVVTYSGYTLAQLEQLAQTQPAVQRLLQQTDLLIDGPYMEALRDLELHFRGSANQRLLDLTGWPETVREADL